MLGIHFKMNLIDKLSINTYGEFILFSLISKQYSSINTFPVVGNTTDQGYQWYGPCYTWKEKGNQRREMIK